MSHLAKLVLKTFLIFGQRFVLLYLFYVTVNRKSQDFYDMVFELETGKREFLHKMS
jgi:hypothetical protein